MTVILYTYRRCPYAVCARIALLLAGAVHATRGSNI